MNAPRIAAYLCLALAALFALRPEAADADVLPDSFIVVREGNADNARIGYSVATAGDVNGDGYSDVLLNGSENNGTVWCYYGETDPDFQAPAWTVSGGTPPGWSNSRVSTAGDVNGDGYDDVLIGASVYSNGEFSEGAVFVYLGSHSGLATTPHAVLEGNVANASLGNDVDTAGDVNGDGYDDILVGSKNYSNGESFEGRALVYLGSAAGIVAMPAWSFESDVAFAYFGQRVAGSGDVNGDGYDDILVSAPDLANGQGGEGRVYLFFGSAAGLEPSPSWTYESNIVGGRAGWGLGCAGDVNGDGYADIVFDVGSNNPAFGAVQIFFGRASVPDPNPNRTVPSGHGAFGDAVYTAGDINGDGFSDLIAGDASDASQTGMIRILGGSPSGPSLPTFANRYGVQSGEMFGVDCAPAGDVDGDGFGDVIVGAPLYDNGNTDEGAVRLYLGHAGAPNTEAAWSPTGVGAGSWYGTSMAHGDWNGDGYSDLAVGSPCNSAGGMNAGSVSVYYGNRFGYYSPEDWLVAGSHAEGNFGHALANAGDIDNDGCDELIVGEPNYGTVDYPHVGAVHIFKGAPGGLATTPWWYQAGGIQPGAFGQAVSGAGDVNGDGYADVLIGAPFYEFPPFERGGAAYLYLGSATGLSTNAIWSAFGGATDDWFGFSVAIVGDLNADGFSDIAVGAPHKESSPALESEGYLYVFNGAPTGIDGSPRGPFRGDQADAQVGFRVAAGGDINGDGYSDFLSGIPFYDGAEGIDCGRVIGYGGSSSSLFGVLFETGLSAGDRLGLAIAGGGDLNGDGFSDVAIGAPLEDHGSPDVGAVYVYMGNNGNADPDPAYVKWGNDSSGLFGYALSIAGDVTGDGFADLIVGQPLYQVLDTGRAYCFNGAREGLPDYEVGKERKPIQITLDWAKRISVLGASNSPSGFRMEMLGRSARGRSTLQVQYQIKKTGNWWVNDPIPGGSFDTGAPISPEGSAVLVNVAVTGLDAATAYRWRMRFLGDSPYFPRSQWFSIPGNGQGETDLRTAPAGTAVASGWGGVGGMAGPALRFSQVGPNPCTDEATISFSMPAAGAARLTVHDVTGRRVATLIDRLLGSGEQSVSWDTRDHQGRRVAAGIYLLRLEHGEDRSSSKLVVQR